MARSRPESRRTGEARHRAASAHRPLRLWWAPWRSRCSCGLDDWPCRHARPASQPTEPASETPIRVAVPEWNGPTVVLTPLLTPAQRWRGNGGAI